MKIFIEHCSGLPVNSDLMKAHDGFSFLGFDCIEFSRSDVLLGKLDKYYSRNVFVGSIDCMGMIFKMTDNVPLSIDYPVMPNRSMWRNVCGKFISGYVGGEYFVKPIRTKLFDGIVIRAVGDLNYLRGFADCEIWVSSVVDIVSEWRYYICGNEIVYGCNYSGDFKIVPDIKFVDEMNRRFVLGRVSDFVIDVCVLKDGTTDLVEFGDFWAVGSYGLESVQYSEMLKRRWFEIIGGCE